MKPNWKNWIPTVRANLVFCTRGTAGGDEVLLIRKKTGFGKGKINGPGGKLEEGETAEESAVREVDEELSLQVRDLQEMGTLRFQFVDGLRMHVTVFLTDKFDGTPTESVEAAPLWFPIDQLPFNEMWEDDRYWLGEMLAGEKFDARFTFEGETMLTKEIIWLNRA